MSVRAIKAGALEFLTKPLEAAIAANRLRPHQRLDLACFVALCLIRSSWVHAHGTEPPDATSTVVADTGRGLYFQYASDLFSRCADNLFDPLAVIQTHEPLAAYVTYPIRCMRIVEIVGLLGLLEAEERTAKWEEIVEFLLHFFQKNPGTSHPISDRWAVSLIPPVLLVAREGHRAEVRIVLENTIQWIGDRYDSENLGLADPYSTPDREIAYLLGSPFEHITLPRRNASYTLR